MKVGIRSILRERYKRYRKFYKYLMEKKRLYQYPRHYIHRVCKGKAVSKNLVPLENHGKPMLIVSLTSFGERFKELHYCLYSLFTQTIRPNKIILWIADGETAVPEEILFYIAYGLEIRYCEDIKSYKKLIPSLKEYSDEILVTADDDVFYDEDWLGQLYAGYIKYPDCIQFHRGRKVVLSDDHFAPYRLWKLIDESQEPSALFMPTGVGGILYPPGIFAGTDVLQQDLFMKLAPGADDLWFWSMAYLKGIRYHPVEPLYISQVPISPLYEYGFKRRFRLRDENTKLGQNDRQLESIFEHYG